MTLWISQNTDTKLVHELISPTNPLDPIASLNASIIAINSTAIERATTFYSEDCQLNVVPPKVKHNRKWISNHPGLLHSPNYKSQWFHLHLYQTQGKCSRVKYLSINFMDSQWPLPGFDIYLLTMITAWAIPGLEQSMAYTTLPTTLV